MFPENPDIATKIVATVKIRRGEGWSVEENAELVDGLRFTFQFAWHITEEDHSLYAGETAWTPYPTPISSKYSGWPVDAPIWIASGDLCDAHILMEPERTNLVTHYKVQQKEDKIND